VTWLREDGFREVVPDAGGSVQRYDQRAGRF
jgi:hypothetical protein